MLIVWGGAGACEDYCFLKGCRNSLRYVWLNSKPKTPNLEHQTLCDPQWFPCSFPFPLPAFVVLQALDKSEATSSKTLWCASLLGRHRSKPSSLEPVQKGHQW